MSLVLQVFSHKPKYWTHSNLDEKSEDHQSDYNSFRQEHKLLYQISRQSVQQLYIDIDIDIPLKTKNDNLVVLEEKSGDH